MPSHDFSAYCEQRCAGRIYRHFDKVRWQWFAYPAPGRGESGIEDSRPAAIEAIESRAM